MSGAGDPSKEVEVPPGETTATHTPLVGLEAAAPDLVPAPDRSWRQRAWDWLANTRPEFSVGTLRYTGFGMIMVFIWLLWGDFCYALLEENLPNILPLKLNDMGASDTTNAILKYSFSYTIIFFLAPVISFRSDRTRTRWGRRIPYLFWSAPAMGIFLILIGCYQEITNIFTGGAEQTSIFGYQVSSAAVAVFVMGVLIVGSDLAGIFANTTYYYLFNDVVPTAYISRFFAFYRIVGTGAGMAYHKLIVPHSLTHFQAIMVIGGIAYMVGFMLMCLFVREGKYPPPSENVIHPNEISLSPRSSVLGRLFNLVAGALLRLAWIRRFVSAVITYATECFTHRLYWFFFLSTAFFYASKLTGMFVMIRNTKSLGISLADIGTLGAWTAFISLLLQYPAGWVADKYHPMRVYVFARIWDMLALVGACVWIFHDFGPAGNLRYLYFLSLVFMPLGLIANAAELPMYMRILPKDRYGQFCSANAMIRALVIILVGWAAGKFIGSFEESYGDRRYVWLAAWQLFFQLITAVFLILLYRQWKLHGGNTNYMPPGTKLQTEAL